MNEVISSPKRTNVVYREKNFFVNADKKTVACQLVFDINLEKLPIYTDFIAGDFGFWAKVDEYLINHPNIHYVDNAETLQFKVTCVAKCSEKDTFDEAFGKRLASTRTQYYAFITATAIYDILYNYVESQYLKPVADLSDGSFKAFAHAEEHLTELIHPEI